MLHYLRRGPGSGAPSRIFLHGFTGSPASWDAVSAHLDDSHADVAMLVPGHHPEVAVRRIVEDPHAPDAFSRVASAMCTALAELPQEGVHLIGYSLGARLALGMLLHAPERFARVTLLGVHPGLQTPAARAARAETDAAWEQVLRDEGMVAFTRRWLAQPLFAGLSRLTSADVAKDIAVRTRHDPLHLADALAATSLARMPSFWQALGSIRRPVCFATGADDEKFVFLLQAARAATPGSTLQIIPGAGHNVLLEAPKSVARLIMSSSRHAP